MVAPDKAPAFQFYTGDWLKDNELQGMDHRHKGFWIDILCLMWDSRERGRLVLPNGDAKSDAAIARLVRVPEDEWKEVRKVLVSYGVASEDLKGVLFNRRMVRDEEKRLVKARSGRKGGQANLSLTQDEISEYPDDVMLVFDYWNEIRGQIPHMRLAQPTCKRLSLVRARLEEGHTVRDLKEAVDGCLGNKKNREGGFIDLELICRSDAKVVQYMSWSRIDSHGGNNHTSLRDYA